MSKEKAMIEQKAAVQLHLDGQFEEAEIAYRALLTNGPNPSVSNNLGYLLMQRKEYGAADQVYKSLVKQSPKLINAWLNWGILKSLRNEYDQAINKFQTALEIDHSRADIWANLAKVYQLTNQWLNAKKAWENAIQILPNNYNYQLMYAGVSLKLNLYSEAMATLHSLEKILPDNANVYQLLGIANTQTKNYGLAEGYFRKSIALNPQKRQTRLELCSVFLAIQDIGKATEVLEQACQAFRDDEILLENLGVLYLGQQKNEMARRVFKKVLSINPSSAKAQKYLEQMEQKTNDPN